MDGNTNSMVLNVTFACFILIGFFLMRYRLHKLQELNELGRPLLLNSNGGIGGGGSAHRLDTATREAAKGYNECSVCAFENFKASRFCMICGAAIATSSSSNDNDNSNDETADAVTADLPGVELHRADASTFGATRISHSDGATAATSSHAVTTNDATLTPRQIRARKRKEWTRKLDIEGKLFWYRASSASGSNDLNDPLHAGYVVSFVDATAVSVAAAVTEQKNAAGLKQQQQQRNSAASVASNASESLVDDDTQQQPLAPPPPPLPPTSASSSSSTAPPTEPPAATTASSVDKTTVALRAAPLTFLHDDVHARVLNATHVDAALLLAFDAPNATADATTLDSIERRRELVAHASQDFPTKFAHFVVSSASLLVPAETEFLKVAVHRAFVLEESIDHVACIDNRYMRSVLRVHFIGESGVDAGGLHREWFALLNERLLSPSTGLFVCLNARDQVYSLNAQSARDRGADHLTYYYATGRLLGRALLEGVVLDCRLALPLRKLMLGIPVTFDDLEDIDPVRYKSLQWIATHDGVEELALDFSVTIPRRCRFDSDSEVDDSNETMDVVDLIPNGRNVAVTDANKHVFLQRTFAFLVFESVAPQLHALVRGLYEVVPPSLLMLFDAEELEYLLCGSQEIDVDDWIRWSVHSSYLALTPVLKWFWDTVRAMPNEYRRRLLQFTTGCSRVPLVGFRGLTSYDGKVCLFTIKVLPAAGPQYIRSHACFNRIDLPLGPTKRELTTMLYAILETEAYGFTTT